MARFTGIKTAEFSESAPLENVLDGRKGHALTDSQIRRLKPRDRIYKCTDGYGLYLEVSPNGSTLWRFKYTHLGKEKRIVLGRYPEIGPAAARRKRDEAKLKLADGNDPLAERKQQKLLALYEAADSLGTSRANISKNENRAPCLSHSYIEANRFIRAGELCHPGHAGHGGKTLWAFSATG